MAKPPKSELRIALERSRGPLLAAMLFSFFINVLLLVSPLYMMQVYDRVLTSRSESTLWLLTLITVGLLLMMGLLEIVRSRVLVRVGAHFDNLLSSRVFSAVFERQLRLPRAHRAQPLNDLGTIRQFMTGAGLFVFFDIPWVPVFLIFLYLVHPLLGIITLVGGVIMLCMAIFSEVMTRRKLERASVDQIAGTYFAETSLRNAEALEAMGMLQAIRGRWLKRHSNVMALQAQASDWAGTLTGISKFMRNVLQTALLGGGAYLAIKGEISAGMMIAASIIGGKALAPIDMAVGSWGGVIGARLAYRRVEDLFRTVPPRVVGMDLPAPTGQISLENAFAVPPGSQIPTVRGVTFDIEAGETVGIIGPSAAGKSTIARLMVGIWPAVSGSVRMDGADIATIPREKIGPYIGYLPQDIELFDGTIAENISRFGDMDPVKVVDAARRAGVHDMILRFPKGYDTPIGEAGGQLSGGQKQRMGLARALYGDPALLIFDEPNSNLDDEGEATLIDAIRQLKATGKTVVIIAHKPSVLVNVDKIMVVREGQVTLFGPRAEIMARVTRPVVAHSAPTAIAQIGG